MRHNYSCAIHCRVLGVMRCFLYELCGFRVRVRVRVHSFSPHHHRIQQEIFLCSASIPCPWHSFGFKLLFGHEILRHASHGGPKNANWDWERQITPVWVKGQTSSCQTSIPVVFFPGNFHVFDVPTREMWLLTWAQVWQWCTDGDDLSLVRSKQDMGFYTHTLSVVRNDPVLYTWLLTSKPDGWGREKRDS